MNNMLLVALDVDAPEKAIVLSEKLKGHVGGFKVGSQLFTLGGPDVVRAIGPTFLDLKFHDIPNTVAGAAKAAAQLGVRMFNVHCLGGSKMMKAARTAMDEVFNSTGTRPLILGVTILTSHDQASLAEVGIDPNLPIPQRVAKLAALAHKSGLDGVVCSPQEIEIVRSTVCDSGFLIVTPGIRRESDPADDQNRTMTVGEAVRRGASYLVVGRPIIAQLDPVAAADAIAEEILTAWAGTNV